MPGLRAGRPVRWLDIEEAICLREARHDRAYHLAQRRIACRLRYAVGDLFLEVYRRGLAFEFVEAG